MKLIRKRPKQAIACVATIGNFDGLHLGHQALIARVVSLARAEELPACVLTFSPSPREFFKQALARVLLLRDKFCYLKELGVDLTWLLRFNAALANLEAGAFVEQYLLESLNLSHLVVGEDFRFGASRLGDVALLRDLFKNKPISVECVPETLIQGKRVSSSWLRQALEAGDFQLAAQLLGRPYQLSGKVSKGLQRGRQLGFPTANLSLHQPLVISGVYAAWVRIAESAEWFKAVVNVGIRPTFHGKDWILEAHVLETDQNLYDQYIIVEFINKIRDEKKFDSIAELRAQISKDITCALEIFNHNPEKIV